MTNRIIYINIRIEMFSWNVFWNRKKIIAVFLFFLVIGTMLFAETVDSLNGPVKKITTSYGKYSEDSSGERVLDKIRLSEKKFDNGLLIEQENTDFVEVFRNDRIVFFYSEDGALLEEKVYNLFNGELKANVVYKYDNYGNLIEKTEYQNGMLENYLRNTYVYTGSTLVSEHVSSSFGLQMDIFYTYQGNKRSEKYLDDDQDRVGEKTTTYDSSGRISREEERSQGQRMERKYTYENGLLSKIDIWEDEDKTATEKIVRRDKYGNWIEKIKVAYPGKIPTEHIFREIEYY